MVCTRRLSEVVLAVVGAVVLWARESRGHWSCARRDAEESNASSPALHVLAASRKKLLHPKVPGMNWQLLCCPAFYCFPRKPQMRLYGTVWWTYPYGTCPVVGVQQPDKKEWLKDESRYRDELCCPNLYRLAKLMAKLGGEVDCPPNECQEEKCRFVSLLRGGSD